MATRVTNKTRERGLALRLRRCGTRGTSTIIFAVSEAHTFMSLMYPILKAKRCSPQQGCYNLDILRKPSDSSKPEYARINRYPHPLADGNNPSGTGLAD
jgi:hypothetical protein